MIYNRIHIVGASGSGTTTLGKAVSKTFGYKQLDSDDYFWVKTDPPYEIQRNVEDRLILLQKDLEQCDKAVISGSFMHWGNSLIPTIDLVIFIYTPTDIRIERLKKREFEEIGDQILPGGDRHDSYIKFIEWAKTYDYVDSAESRSLKNHEQWLTTFSCPILRLKGENKIADNIQVIKEYMAQKS